MSEAASEITWLSHVMKDLGISLMRTPLLYCDNLSSIYLTANPASHKRSKHFETHHHYVRERVALGLLEVKHLSSHMQIADIFTKSLPITAFESLRYKLGVDVPPTPSLRGANNRTMQSGEEKQVRQGENVKTEVLKPKLSSQETKPIRESMNAQRLVSQTEDTVEIAGKRDKADKLAKAKVT
ncbi:unnamed protein product [Microthlaspi erraticum]|uniref:Reverse transcriptase Ty1/copia-type domain-containing protein n=1 Tax=Microthlaspi erraticum TaxID=1685480 RepID=A0A6D2LFR6_9BRAS|nr:unnamed protein product [Microthlaspi erraticum]